MKKIIFLLLLIIIGLAIVLMRERARSDELIAAAERSELQALSACRKSVAELRFQCQANETGVEEVDPAQKISELQTMLQERRLKAREDAVDELIETLGLSSNLKPEITSILNEFDDKRRALIGQSREDGAYLTPGFYENLNILRVDTARKLEQKMSGEQWQKLVGNDFLPRLGLSPVEPTERTTFPVR